MRQVARLLRHVLATLGSALVGTFVRFWRRIRGAPPRVWFGPRVFHFTPWQVAATRLAGFPTMAVAESVRGKYELLRAEDSDVVWEEEGILWFDRHWKSLRHLLLHGDVWFAYFDSAIFPSRQRRANLAAIRLLRLCGIKIIVLPHGGDVVYRDSRRFRFDWVGRVQRDYPGWDLTAERPNAQFRVKLFCRYADIVVGADSTVNRFLPRRDLLYRGFPIDVDALSPVFNTRNKRPIIVHAPQHRYVKGTDILLAACEDLKNLGFDFELRLVEKVARREALRIYAEADIVVDQLCMGAYGLFALETMALGKPVLCYLDEETLGEPVWNHPFVNAHEGNVREVLAALLSSAELRERLGRAGRASIERYDSIEASADVFRAMVRFAWNGDRLDVSSCRAFERQRGSRTFCQDPAKEEFWPVKVDDLFEQMIGAISRLSGTSAVAVEENR